MICFYSSLYYRLVGPLEVARLFNGEVRAELGADFAVEQPGDL